MKKETHINTTGIVSMFIWMACMAAVSSCHSNITTDTNTETSRLIAEVVTKNKEIDTYKTQVNLAFKEGVQTTLSVQWDVQYVSPDNFFVDQLAHEKTGFVTDRWISIGRSSYQYYAENNVWCKNPFRWAEQNRYINDTLKADKWLRQLKQDDILSTKTVQEEQKEYIVFYVSPNKYKDSSKFKGFGILEISPKAICSSEVWISRDSLLLSKAVLRISQDEVDGKLVDIQYDQSFKEYNSDIRITKPKDMVH